MTLFELIKAHPDKFYKQDWYWDEPFMDKPLPLDKWTVPTDAGYRGMEPFLIAAQLEEEAVPAVVLAYLYVQNPDHPIWMSYLWTSDLDSQGQRVYVGDNGKGMEIHRHLHITDRFGVPTWEDQC